MYSPTSHSRSGRLMTRQESGPKIDAILSASETAGRRIAEGKLFDCSRGLGRVRSSNCLARMEAQDDPCCESQRGVCAHGYVAQQRAAGRL